MAARKSSSDKNALWLLAGIAIIVLVMRKSNQQQVIPPGDNPGIVPPVTDPEPELPSTATPPYAVKVPVTDQPIPQYDPEQAKEDILSEGWSKPIAYGFENPNEPYLYTY